MTLFSMADKEGTASPSPHSGPTSRSSASKFINHFSETLVTLLEKIQCRIFCKILKPIGLHLVLIG